MTRMFGARPFADRPFGARLRAGLAGAALALTVLLSGCGGGQPVTPEDGVSQPFDLDRELYSLTAPEGWVEIDTGEAAQLDTYLAKGDEESALTSGTAFNVFVDSAGYSTDEVLEGSRQEMPDASDAEPITIDGVEFRGVTSTVEGLTMTQYVGEVDGTTLALNASWPAEENAEDDFQAIVDSITWKK